MAQSTGGLEAPPVAGVATFGGLPEANGREEVFFACSTCHSIKLVLQQRLSRDDWDETLEWMVEEQGMPPLDSDRRERVLDYLGGVLGPEAPRR